MPARKRRQRARDRKAEGRGGSWLLSRHRSGFWRRLSNVPRFVPHHATGEGPLATEEPSREKGIEAGRAVDSPFTGGDIVIVTGGPCSGSATRLCRGLFPRAGCKGLSTLARRMSDPCRQHRPPSHRFAGDAIYPDGPGAVQIRVGDRHQRQACQQLAIPAPRG